MSTYSYGNDELQQIKVWNYNPDNKHTYIYIHGGAWKDPKNTFDELAPVANTTPESTFIGINYRLTSQRVKHPLHLVDVARAIIYIATNFKTQQKHLLGYSVGATMILQFLQFKYHFSEAFDFYVSSNPDDENYGEFGDLLVADELHLLEDNENLIARLDELIKSDQLYFTSVKFLDGIYDLPELIEEYPQYAPWFINEAYPDAKLIALTSLSNPILINNGKLAPATYTSNASMIDAKTTIYIVHSLQDELLSLKQTQLLSDFFNKTLHGGCIVMTGNWGKHDDVYGDNRKEIFLFGGGVA
ncbi:hypothetical protein FOB58_005861 [Candida parapsilosis]|uniref:BD-FAE-like domain-containing protein n=2 Tax=Candida parapsilosis TaxID=5480 RepID=G8BL59_CANPC|nr:uncharacterized protein CPAR2_700520 [Candida parapsilosis]KAF6041793.1 hypothetical protein FOB58_005861 [Candida parapsilosis]KAF6041946.1 hypothetical protein FOB59_005839 [Candida parapsilosis]KAF6042657.1 hypothetical protein FOB60_005856 [Candida parapsilosis]KAF6058317.1 hypothetical protein FOB61_005478 [Candida parapsilosis]KAI5901240.1 Kynurenine formamidase [Candida parapsilosis]